MGDDSINYGNILAFEPVVQLLTAHFETSMSLKGDGAMIVDFTSGFPAPVVVVINKSIANAALVAQVGLSIMLNLKNKIGSYRNCRWIYRLQKQAQKQSQKKK